MKFEFPDTGEGVTEGKFLEWKVTEGDTVEEDQIVGEAETDKAVVDIPAPADGVVKELKASPGDKVNVGDIIMILDKDAQTEGDTSETEEASETDKPEAETSERSESSMEESSDQVDAVMGGSPSASSYDDEEEKDQEPDEKNNTESSSSSGEVLAMPRVRKKAREEGIDLSELEVEGKITLDDLEGVDYRSHEEDTEDEPEQEAKDKREDTVKDQETIDVEDDVKARPSVRKLAREHHIELSMIDGSGRDGEITREDVLNAAGEEVEEAETSESSESSSAPETESSEKPVVETEGEVEGVEMSGIRKVTAERMKESKFSAPHVTHVEKADITELVELRESVKSEVDAHLTYLPFIMKACVAGLKQYPRLNSELDEKNDEVLLKKFYDFNIAVDTYRGLLVPRIDNIDGKSMVELAQDIGDKAEKAQNGDLGREEMAPGTFSITNLGVIGGEAFTPIIYPPQSAILGIGKIQETAEVVDGEVVPRKTVKLSLSYDHRVVDGAEAARFMNKVVKDLENPRELIIDM